MSSGIAVLLAFGIGIVAGLRSLTAPAVVAWAAYLGGSIFMALHWLLWVLCGPLASSPSCAW